MFKVCLLSTLMCAGTIVSSAIAQDAAAPAQAPVFEAPEQYSPSWSDKGIAKIADQLSGTWKSSQSNEDGSSMWLTIAPAPVDGMSDMLFVESVRSTSPWDPFRYSFFQLYRYKGEVRLRTYEIGVKENSKGVMAGMWGATEYFPEMSSDSLIATLDIELTDNATGFTGSTPYPYPTGVSGAVEMTSSMTIDGDTMTVADRGYNASGDVVWGAQADSAFSFERSEPYASVTRRDDGLVLIDYTRNGGVEPHDGDQLSVHYRGYLSDGSQFDASYDRGEPFTFEYPPGARAIAGWGFGMEGFAMGDHRKLVIPGYLAYGERGNPRARIAPNSTLYFNAYMAHIAHVEPTEGGAVDPHAGHNHD